MMTAIANKSQLYYEIKTQTDVLHQYTALAVVRLTETLSAPEYKQLSDDLITVRDGPQAILSTGAAELTSTEHASVVDTLTRATNANAQLDGRINLMNTSSVGGKPSSLGGPQSPTWGGKYDETP